MARLNSKAHERYQIDPAQVVAIARASQYTNAFYGRLSQLEHRVERGRYPPDPHEYLRSGKAETRPLAEAGESQMPQYRRPTTGRSRLEEPEAAPALARSLDRVVSRIAQALPAKSQPQEVRSEEEKSRDFEYEM